MNYRDQQKLENAGLETLTDTDCIKITDYVRGLTDYDLLEELGGLGDSRETLEGELIDSMILLGEVPND